jgi:uncharacterized protein
MDVLLYLLESGADYTKNFGFTYNPSGAPRHDTTYICQRLRQNIFDLNSLRYKQKMLVVAFLKKHGYDYFNTPIPDYIVDEIKRRYPNSWGEFLEKY